MPPLDTPFFSVNQDVWLEILPKNVAVRTAVVKIVPDSTWLKIYRDQEEVGTLDRGVPVKLKFWDAFGLYYSESIIGKRRLPNVRIIVVDPPGPVVAIQKRAFHRVAMALDMSLVVLKAANPALVTPNPIPGRTKDISGGGLRFVCAAGLAQGDTVQVTVRLEVGLFVQAEARVAWRRMEPRGEGQEQVFGLEFTKINEKAQDAVVAFLFNVQTKRRRELLGRNE